MVNTIERALYRGKGIDTGEWRFGYLVRTEFGVCYITVWTHNKDGYGEFAYYEVNRETVGQWTGRNDIEGNKIFHKDITKDDIGRIITIEYDEEDCGYYGLYKNATDTTMSYVSKYSKVIGNKFDNLELLKGRKLAERR